MTAAPSPLRVIAFSAGLEKMRLSRSTAYRLMRDPTSDFLRPFKVGCRWAYLESDIEQWLQRQASAAQMVAPAPEPSPDALSL